MRQANALLQGIQAQPPSPRDTLETIVEELQVIVEELQSTYEEFWIQQETLWERQERILRENDRYSSFFQFISEGAMFTDGEGLITIANRALGELLQLPEHGLVGTSILTFVPLGMKSDFWSRLRSLSQQTVIQNWETVLHLHNGEFLPVTLSVKGCPTLEGEELCWLVRDRSVPQAAEASPLATQNPDSQNIVQSTAALTAINQQLRSEVEARKRAEQALQFKARQEQLLHTIANRIRRSLELDQVLTATVAEVQQLLQVDRVMILQFMADGTKLVATEARNEVYPSLLKQAYQEPCFHEQGIEHYRQGRLRAFEDILAEDAQLHPCLVETLLTHEVRALLLIPILQQDRVWGMLVVHHCSHPRPWPNHEQALLTQLATQVSIAIEQSALFNKTQRLSRVDGMTEIANRRWFDDYLNQMWKQHQRDQTPLALVLADVDYFKAYNDTYGHPAGDYCLRTIAQLLDRHVRRPNDLVARYGGEEFAAILPNTNLAGGIHIAETFLENLSHFRLPHRASPLKMLTLSIGVISLVPEVGEKVGGFIQGADQALYQAKAQGRNQIVAWQPPKQ
jgi:diguanylate cyclase (GGDEF)-like protein